MDILFLCVVIFLFLLAVFDLSVGVSNDAVNFLNSALGSKAASFKRVLAVAAIGVFIGAAMSNGMMDIARHGIFRPEYFSFYELICIFMAVMVTDIILLDVFNSLGMPTSTTVSMVFELLGATFVVALVKMAGGIDLGLQDLLNTEKALSVILGIFLSVAIAFFFGIIVQFISRTIFSFNYRSRLKWKIGVFGGICATSIVYFLLLKGAKDLTFMTPEVKAWIKENTCLILVGCMAFFTVFMQLLHWLKVNVLKVVILMGTFALAMAFAGNDLVNFLGVPLSGLASYQDYMINGGGDVHGFLMGSLNAPANTPVYFLIGAGVIMVVALATSKKAQNVSKTEIGLTSQNEVDEMFGSSRIARRLVRMALNMITWIRWITPPRVKNWFRRRFNADDIILERGAEFDLIRGSVNLVLTSMLIAFGTSLKLPLSTTFVSFMVAMGTSLADRAWGRESAVFRITGVISVIGGWLITASVAFIGAGVIVLLMHFGGHWVMMALAALTIVLLVNSNRRFKRRKKDEGSDIMFRSIMSSKDKEVTWNMLLLYITRWQQQFISYAEDVYRSVTEAFINENVRALRKAESSLRRKKSELKNIRRRETLCLRKVKHETAIEKSTWFYLSNNSCMSILYNLRRINEACKEHVEDNFLTLPPRYTAELEQLRTQISTLLNDSFAMMDRASIDTIPVLRKRCDEIKALVSDTYHRIYQQLREGDPASMRALYVYLNILQETREMVSGIKKYLRAYAKLHDTEFRSRQSGKIFLIPFLLAVFCFSPCHADNNNLYTPELHGTIRAKYEYEPPIDKGRFEIRNARLNVEGNVAPIAIYKAEIDLSDEGEIKMLDAYVGLQSIDALRFTFGQMRVPFSIDAHRSPHLQYFANRSFIAKQVGNVRDVGASVCWGVGQRLPLTLEAGIFNGSGLTNQKDFWTNDYNFSFKAQMLIARQYNITLSCQKASAADVGTMMYDIGTYWHSERWHLEAEYLRKSYSRGLFSPVNAVDAFVAYRLPINKGLNAISFLGRYDYMSDHSKGSKDESGMLTVDDPERHRLTGGVTLSLGKKNLQTDVRLNYERYFYQKSATTSISEQNKIIVEFVAHF